MGPLLVKNGGQHFFSRSSLNSELTVGTFVQIDLKRPKTWQFQTLVFLLNVKLICGIMISTCDQTMCSIKKLKKVDPFWNWRKNRVVCLLLIVIWSQIRMYSWGTILLNKSFLGLPHPWINHNPQVLYIIGNSIQFVNKICISEFGLGELWVPEKAPEKIFQ